MEIVKIEKKLELSENKNDLISNENFLNKGENKEHSVKESYM